MDILWIGIGGFIGAISRFAVVDAFSRRSISSIPFETLTVNLAGSFLLGLLYGLTLNLHLTALLGTGFLGAFTTFSTFQYEIVQIRRLYKWRSIVSYVSISVISGIAFCALGYVLGHLWT